VQKDRKQSLNNDYATLANFFPSRSKDIPK